MRSLKEIRHETDILVVGGGMAGLLAALSAARHGAKVILMQDRPVLGGNASSEVRMWIRGAAGTDNRETGLLQEIEMENIRRNPSCNFSLWDSVLFDFAWREKNLTLLMNCACLKCDCAGDKIVSVTGFQGTTQALHTVTAGVFLDCSGDSILAYLSGAEYRVGREAAGEFDEYGAEQTADACTMGNSCLIQARETDHACPFTPPAWANVYPTDESMYLKDHDFTRTGTNFWWIELGGREDTIKDAETLRDELVRTAFGVWDHIKNRGEHGADNWELEWVGFLPGKRESRRCVGDYLLNQRDLEEGTDFPDVVAFGGWTMDNHSPDGIRFMGYSSRHIKPQVPYGIPYRSLYSVNIDNLMFAGRNISATHMAMSSTRVMATCAVIGQAAGTAAALAVRCGLSPRAVGQQKIALLQTLLLEDGCFLPGHTRALPACMAGAAWSLPPQQAAALQNGWERPQGEASNRLLVEAGTEVEITLSAPARGARLRLALDPDFSRESITQSRKIRYFAMRANYALADEAPRMPANLARDITVRYRTAEGKTGEIALRDNARPLVFVDLPENTLSVRARFESAWGAGQIGLYALDITDRQA